MDIKGAKTIEDFKRLRDEKVQRWVDERFIAGAVTWRWVSASKFEISDTKGDSMEVSMYEI